MKGTGFGHNTLPVNSMSHQENGKGVELPTGPCQNCLELFEKKNHILLDPYQTE